MIKHRRIPFAAGVLTPDPDWAGTHTLWDSGPDLAGGEIVDVTPKRGALAVYFEVYDGMADNANPMAPGTTTIDAQIVTRHRGEGVDEFELGLAVSGAFPQRRLFEREIGPQGLSVVRVTGASVTGTGAIWISVEDSVLT